VFVAAEILTKRSAIDFQGVEQVERANAAARPLRHAIPHGYGRERIRGDSGVPPGGWRDAENAAGAGFGGMTRSGGGGVHHPNALADFASFPLPPVGGPRFLIVKLLGKPRARAGRCEDIQSPTARVHVRRGVDARSDLETYLPRRWSCAVGRNPATFEKRAQTRIGALNAGHRGHV